MSAALPPGVEQAFVAAAGELGMCTAAWLMVDTLAPLCGADGIRDLNATVGPRFPVLDYVTDRFLRGLPRQVPPLEETLSALAGVKRLVVVGTEARVLDGLLPRLSGVRVHVVTDGPLPADWERVLGNLGDVEPLAPGDVLTCAGTHSALLTFLYGVDQDRTHVIPTWLRAVGPDVRTAFRALVGCNVLADRLRLYPRWLSEVNLSGFSHVVGT